MTSMKIAYIKARLQQIDTIVDNSTLEDREHSYSGDSYLYEVQLEQTHLINTLGGTR